MNIKKFYAMLFCSILFSKAGIAAAAPEDRCISDPAQMSRLVRAHPDITTLIVGCGKKPYAWEEEALADQNAWRSSKDRGDHTHGDAWTCAETDSVNPNFILDMTQVIPEELHGLFGTVYMEKLPPRVLGKPIVWENAMKLLVPGGRAIADHQYAIRGANAEEAQFMILNNALITILKEDGCTVLVSPQLPAILGEMDEVYVERACQTLSLKTGGKTNAQILAERTDASIKAVTVAYAKSNFCSPQAGGPSRLQVTFSELLEEAGLCDVKFVYYGGTKPNPFNFRKQLHNVAEARKPGELPPARVVSSGSPEELAKKQRQRAVKKVKVEGEEAEAALRDFKIKARRSNTFTELLAEFPDDDVGTLLQPWEEDDFYRLPLTNQESVTFKVIEEAPLRISQVKIVIEE